MLLSTGELQNHLWVSLGRVARGLGIGLSAGLALALVSGLFRWGEDLLDPPIQMLRTLPVLALVPLFILSYGGIEISCRTMGPSVDDRAELANADELPRWRL